jgi:murein DD-endopeptidase MepM/ murein hydrolase activator NlpD
MSNSPRLRLLVVIVLALGALVTLIWALSKRQRAGTLTTVTTESPHTAPSVTEPTIASPSPTAPPSAEPTPQPSLNQPEGSPQPSTSTQPSPSVLPSPNPPTASLLIPVAGVSPDELRDTFSEARAEGRTHDAIDIPAPLGTPVLAAADGRIIKLFQSKPGGTTIYQLDPDNRTVYYYAHLERYADGLVEGDFAHRGEVIAYVGDTGNAGAGNYHLHFSISIVADPKRYWEGTNINPYPLLRRR